MHLTCIKLNVHDVTNDTHLSICLIDFLSFSVILKRLVTKDVNVTNDSHLSIFLINCIFLVILKRLVTKHVNAKNDSHLSICLIDFYLFQLF